MFPYEKIRPGQKELMEDVSKWIKEGKNLIAHAPTGIGKTAAVLTSTLEYALKNDKTIFFLTSRHSQHILAIDTLKQMREKSDKEFVGSNLIGKKWMCSQEDLSKLPSSDFYNYCEKLRESNKCEKLNRTLKKGKLTKTAKKKLENLFKKQPLHTEEVKESCKDFCPYEISLNLLSNSDVVVCDYFHIFSPTGINLLNRLNLNLEDLIVIVDEAHNLPSRLRSLVSYRLSSYILENAIKESKEFGFDDLREDLKEIFEALKDLSKTVKEECYLPKNAFVNKINKIGDYQELMEDFQAAGEVILEEKKRSFTASTGRFLENWTGEDEGFTRILSKEKGNKKTFISLDYKCLDPSIVSEEIIKDSHSTILMSGTMKPMKMYIDLLGMNEKRTEAREYESNFPDENRLNLVFPEVTTKYKERSKSEFQKIAKNVSKLIEKIPGNSIVFFPSYKVMEKVKHFISINKTILKEDRKFSKPERKEILKKMNKTRNNVLFAVMGGSFSEGIDLPGKALEGIVVVGIPLAKPNLEIKSLIEYYKKKFGNGWDYAYTYPALIKVAQACGRLIRSKEDKGIVALMDKRYTWRKYGRLFSGWNAKLTRNPENDVDEFFM